MNLDARYPRATSEKALLDWVYLGASPRTKIALPPIDIDMELLDRDRLERLAAKMGLDVRLKDYLSRGGVLAAGGTESAP